MGPVTVSNTSDIFWSLFDQFLYLGVIVGVVVIAILTYMAYRYRAVDGDASEDEDVPKLGGPPVERGSARFVALTLGISATILLVLIVGTFGALTELENPPETDALEVNVVGFQFGWTFIYQNGHEEIGELRVPRDRAVVLNVTSSDVFHSLGIVEFRAKRDAIPGVNNEVWFEATETGTYSIRCFELCGVGHAEMTADLVVMEPQEFEEWYSGLEGG